MQKLRKTTKVKISGRGGGGGGGSILQVIIRCMFKT